MQSFDIYHSIGQLRFTEAVDQERELAGSVIASSLEDAYLKSQNWSSPWNKKAPCRSTSVGDMITSPQGKFMVKLSGFQKIEEPAIN